MHRPAYLIGDCTNRLPTITRSDFIGWFTESYPEIWNKDRLRYESLNPEDLTRAYRDILGIPSKKQFRQWFRNNFPNAPYRDYDLNAMHDAVTSTPLIRNKYLQQHTDPYSITLDETMLKDVEEFWKSRSNLDLFVDWFNEKFSFNRFTKEEKKQIYDCLIYYPESVEFRQETERLLQTIKLMQNVTARSGVWETTIESRAKNYFNSEAEELKIPTLFTLLLQFMYKRHDNPSDNERSEVDYIDDVKRKNLISEIIELQYNTKIQRNEAKYRHKKSFLYEYGNAWNICGDMHPLLGWCAKIMLDNVEEILQSFKSDNESIEFGTVSNIFTSSVKEDEYFKRHYETNVDKDKIAQFIGECISLVFYGYTSIGLYSIIGVLTSNGDLIADMDNFVKENTIVKDNAKIYGILINNELLNSYDDAGFYALFGVGENDIEGKRRIRRGLQKCKTNDRYGPPGSSWYYVNENKLIRFVFGNIYVGEGMEWAVEDAAATTTSNTSSKNYTLAIKDFINGLSMFGVCNDECNENLSKYLVNFNQIDAPLPQEEFGVLELFNEILPSQTARFPFRCYEKQNTELNTYLQRFELDGENNENDSRRMLINFLILSDSPGQLMTYLLAKYKSPECNNMFKDIRLRPYETTTYYKNALDIIRLQGYGDKNYTVYLTHLINHYSLMIYVDCSKYAGLNSRNYCYMYYENLLYIDGITISHNDLNTVEKAFSSALTLFSDLSPDMVSVKARWFPKKPVLKQYQTHYQMNPIKGELESVMEIYGGSSYIDAIVTLLKIILVVLIILIAVIFISKAWLMRNKALFNFDIINDKH